MTKSERLQRDLRTAMLGVLSEHVPDPDRLAIAVYGVDQHARQLADELDGERLETVR